MVGTGFFEGADREQFIDEVTEVVLARTGAQTAKVIQSVESKGQCALEAMHQQQLQLMGDLERKLGKFEEIRSTLVQQNKALRTGVEAAIRQVQMLQWSGGALPPYYACPPSPWIPAPLQTPQSVTKSAASMPGRTEVTWGRPKYSKEDGDTDAMVEAGRDDSNEDEDDHHDGGGDNNGYDDSHRPATPPKKYGDAEGGSSLDDTASTITPPDSPMLPSISLTFRRLDGQPLGLEVRPDCDRNCLHVERIQKGTVADAWNKQCIGEPRTILPGDRVISVNGVTTVEEMRQEFSKKLLLKIELLQSR